jgi:hypothetical protein
MSGKRQKTQDSLASEQTDRGETLVSGYEGAEPLVANRTGKPGFTGTTNGGGVRSKESPNGVETRSR